MYLLKVFKSIYCRLVFLFSAFASYFLIPSKVFIWPTIILAVLFIIVFSVNITCLAKNIKEKVIQAKVYSHSLLGLISSIFGFSALQVCTVGAPICGAGIGAGLVAVMFPSFMVNFLMDFSVLIIIFSIAIQAFSIYYLNCLRVR